MTKPDSKFKKIAKNRGPAWKKALTKGRLDSELYPTEIKKLRVSLGLSQEALATKLGLSNSTYGGIERGKRLVNQKRALALAQALKTKVEKIFSQKEKAKLLAIK